MKEYEAMVVKEKARYADEMKGYVAPDVDDNDDIEDEDDIEGSKKKKVSKKKKDPNAPKKPMSAYMLFSNHIRATVKDDNPALKFGDIAKVVSEKYKQFTEKDKALWGEKAEEDKKRYKQEMAAFMKKKVAKATEDLDDDEDEDEEDEDEE